MLSVDQPITILKELREHIIPLGEEELFLLEKSLTEEGCREPLIVWEKNESQLVLVDGHNRFKICQKKNIPYKIRKIKLNSIEDAKVWMIDNQIGRRNLNPDQMSYYRGLKYLSLKKRKGGYDNVKSKGQSETSTSEVVASFFKVSESTIKRDAKFAEGLNIVGRTNPKLKAQILTGESKVKKGDVQALCSAKNPDRLSIKNEADLFNKAKIIKAEILEEVESGLKKLEREKSKNLQGEVKNSEPIFLDKSDRLRRIKGLILSAINKAINERDVKAIKELKRLIEKLEDELFD
ncbi:ParB N-terminal domain-containing protein [Chryseolinea sp. H1M3-3]|uniref:ParB N-terminal domain-containing protein n=1 Tax=Chryseolinea sp. H1M3-3 TaxID=3034144 RepID=UPI0023ED6C9A|nr:ParB N-terminal domain-containing protein [Chryseolinea sp. H1M3-3]